MPSNDACNIVISIGCIALDLAFNPLFVKLCWNGVISEAISDISRITYYQAFLLRIFWMFLNSVFCTSWNAETRRSEYKNYVTTIVDSLKNQKESSSLQNI